METLQEATEQVTSSASEQKTAEETFNPSPISEVFRKDLNPSPEPKDDKVGQEPKEEVIKQDAEKKETNEKEAGKKEVVPGDKTEKPKIDYEKRYWDTARYANELNQRNIALQKKLEIIEKKIDGTYDPEVDEPKPLLDERGLERIEISRAVALEKYGDETINNLIFAEDAPFREIENIPDIAFRVLNSKLPLVEAVELTKEYLFTKEYGNTIDDITKNINARIKEAKEAALKEAKEQFQKELNEKISNRDSLPVGIRDVQGGNGTNTEVFSPTPISSIFRKSL